MTMSRRAALVGLALVALVTAWSAVAADSGTRTAFVRQRLAHAIAEFRAHVGHSKARIIIFAATPSAVRFTYRTAGKSHELVLGQPSHSGPGIIIRTLGNPTFPGFQPDAISPTTPSRLIREIDPWPRSHSFRPGEVVLTALPDGLAVRPHLASKLHWIIAGTVGGRRVLYVAGVRGCCLQRA